MKKLTRIVEQGRNKVLEEYLAFDDLQEYLDWYLEEHNENWYNRNEENKDTIYPFERVGYEKWKPLKIDGEFYYSLYQNDYEKLTTKAYKALLEYADKTYSIHIDQQKYFGNQGNSRFTGDCETVDKCVENSKIMAQASIDYYQKQIDEIQVKIDYLNKLNHKELVTTNYKIKYPKEATNE